MPQSKMHFTVFDYESGNIGSRLNDQNPAVASAEASETRVAE
jgi:hypothetical protein